MRLTRKNPDGKTYRLPCTEQTPGIRIDHRMGYPTLFGVMIDRIGRMEDTKSLEEWEKDIKKQLPSAKGSRTTRWLPKIDIKSIPSQRAEVNLLRAIL